MKAFLVRVLALVKREPAVVTTVLAALFGLALAFGVPLTTQQEAAIGAAATVAAGIYVRSQVTPTP